MKVGLFANWEKAYGYVKWGSVDFVKIIVKNQTILSPESQARNSNLLLESIHLSFTAIQPQIFFLSFSFSQSNFHFIIVPFRYVYSVILFVYPISTHYLVIFIRITQYSLKPIAILCLLKMLHCQRHHYCDYIV